MNTHSQPVPSDLSFLSAEQQLGMMNLALSALKQNPKNISALLTVAGLFEAQKNFPDAIATLQKALALARKNPEILRRLATVASRSGDLALARKYARKLTEVEPRVAINHKQYGVILDKLGFPAAAIQAYQKADRVDPGSAETLYCIGQSYAMMGNHEKALEYYERSHSADPHYGMALYALSSARKFAAHEVDDFIARVEAAVPLSQNAPMAANLHFGAGKVLDDTKRYDEAFERYAKANALRRPQTPGPVFAPFLNSTQAFSREFYLGRQGYGLPTDQPIFIVGMPRSGTTLVESLCGAHSKVTAGDERTAIHSMAERMGRDGEVEGAYARNIAALTIDKTRALAGEYLERCKAISGSTPHFTDKMPHNFLDIGLIALLFPNARIIHCRRHPLDTCLSLYANSMFVFHNRYKTDLELLGRYYRQYLKLMQHWHAVLPGRIHDVCYEDVVANTELNARAIIRYLGLEWEDGVMERSGSQRSVRNLSQWQVRQPVYQTSKGKWRNYEKHLAPLVEALGQANVDAYERELAGLA